MDGPFAEQANDKVRQTVGWIFICFGGECGQAY